MTLEIIVVFCIKCRSFTFFYVVFNPSPHFSISFEILNEAKLIYHHVNGNSCRINPIFNVVSPKSILLVMVYYFFVSFFFGCKSIKLWLLVIMESIKCQIFSIVPHFLTPFNNSFHLSFVS